MRKDLREVKDLLNILANVWRVPGCAAWCMIRSAGL